MWHEHSLRAECFTVQLLRHIYWRTANIALVRLQCQNRQTFRRRVRQVLYGRCRRIRSHQIARQAEGLRVEGEDADVKALAGKMLPTVEEHLHMAKNMPAVNAAKAK